jgi:pyruvate/2-oxoglutarate dehydrogenase complex dihydrolipoamide acyltransferase (E2) component
VEQVSAPVKIFGLIAVLAALGAGAFMMTAGRTAGGPESVDETALVPLKPVAQAKAVAGKLSAHNEATAAGQPDATQPAATKPQPAAKKAAAPAKPTPAATKPAAKKTKTHAGVKLEKGTPTTIAGQLALHQVVVVLIYNPEAKVDEYSVLDTKLGAKEAGAGFLAVNVLDQKQASPFTTAYGVIQDPSVLFFKRPGKLALKLVGYADHDTIAQAARNAALGLGTVTA